MEDDRAVTHPSSLDEASSGCGDIDTIGLRFVLSPSNSIDGEDTLRLAWISLEGVLDVSVRVASAVVGCATGIILLI